MLFRSPNTKCIAIDAQEELRFWNKHFDPFVSVAVTDKNTTVNLTEGCGWTASTKDGFYDGKAIEVPGMPLDDICKAEYIEHIDILKIDVDGAEQGVFDGGSEALKNCDWIIVETNGPLPDGFDWHTTNGYDFVGKRQKESEVNDHAEEGQEDCEEDGQVTLTSPGHRAPVAGELKGGTQ